MDHYHGELDGSPEQLSESEIDNACASRQMAERILAVRSRIALINTDIDKPSAQKDWPDLLWACEELKAIATEIKEN